MSSRIELDPILATCIGCGATAPVVVTSMRAVEGRWLPSVAEPPKGWARDPRARSNARRGFCDAAECRAKLSDALLVARAAEPEPPPPAPPPVVERLAVTMPASMATTVGPTPIAAPPRAANPVPRAAPSSVAHRVESLPIVAARPPSAPPPAPPRPVLIEPTMIPTHAASTPIATQSEVHTGRSSAPTSVIAATTPAPSVAPPVAVTVGARIPATGVRVTVQRTPIAAVKSAVSVTPTPARAGRVTATVQGPAPKVRVVSRDTPMGGYDALPPREIDPIAPPASVGALPQKAAPQAATRTVTPPSRILAK